MTSPTPADSTDPQQIITDAIGHLLFGVDRDRAAASAVALLRHAGLLRSARTAPGQVVVDRELIKRAFKFAEAYGYENLAAGLAAALSPDPSKAQL